MFQTNAQSSFTLKVKSFVKRSVFAVAVTMMSLTGVSASATTGSDDLPLKGQVLVAAFSVIPPFVNLNDSLTKPSGLDIDILLELQRRTGFELKNNSIEIMNFSEMVELGQNNQLDIIGGSISYNEHRASIYELTRPYFITSVSLVTRKNSNIQEMKDLANRTVAVQRGTNMAELLEGIPNVRTFEVPSTFMAFYAVSRGQADAMFIDTPVAQSYAHEWQNGNLKLVMEIPGSKSAVCFIFKKNSPNNVHLQKAFEDMRADGTLSSIINKYIKRG